jgi:tRNA(Ile)-lysidine synthase
VISLPQNFIRALTGPCRIREGTRLLVAVSGGPDSMALLHLLAAVRQRLELALFVVWVDHGLRPLETPREEELVHGAAQRLDVPFFARRIDVSGYAAEKHHSLEHAARDLRYSLLREVCRTCSADCIAVAHTADDQAEEILLRMVRGSGRKGVAGMRMRSRDLIRPLLSIDKAELLEWLEEQEIAYALDSSNNDLKFLRNRVRHQLLPFLEQHFDVGIRKALRKTADSLAADEELLAELTEKAGGEVVCPGQEKGTLRIMRKPFIALSEALQRRVVEQVLWQLSSRANYDHILMILDAAAHGRPRSELHLSRGLRLGIFREYLQFSYPAGRSSWRGSLFSR